MFVLIEATLDSNSSLVSGGCGRTLGGLTGSGGIPRFSRWAEAAFPREVSRSSQPLTLFANPPATSVERAAASFNVDCAIAGGTETMTIAASNKSDAYRRSLRNKQRRQSEELL